MCVRQKAVQINHYGWLEIITRGIKMKTGDKAKIVHPVIEGVIIDTEYDKEKEQLKHLLEYEDVNGEITQRWFADEEIQQVVTKGEK